MSTTIIVRILGSNPLGWELAVAKRMHDGTYWAIIHDGLSFHDGPIRTSGEAAEEDILIMTAELIAMGCMAKEHSSSTKGAN